MRKLIISIFLIVAFYFAIPIAFCQDLKLLNSGNIWSNLIQTSQSENCCTYSRFIKFSGDTVIQNLEYKKVLQSEDSIQNIWEIIGFVREDEQKGLYYKELYYTQQERLLYYYNLKLNDTVKIQSIFDDQDSVSFIVSNVEEVMIDGDIKKIFTLHYPEYNNFTETWIESIGSLHGILREGFYHCLCNNYALLCCFNNDKLIYKNPDYDRCYYNKTPTNGQLKADAGVDKIICSDEFAVEIEIGGSPTASGGVEPYTYLWFGKFVGTEDNEPIVYDLGRMLDDSTKSNPTTYLHDIPEKWTALYLKVEDATGQFAYDTLNFIHAGIWRQLLFPNFQYIVKGDSVKLINPYLENPLTPISYSISPSQGLTDSTDINGWAKPGYNINYSIQAINSLGCVSGKFDYMHINVVNKQTDSVYKAKLDSVSNLLIGEWEWYDSGGGLGGGGFGGPEENGYTVKAIVEKDEFSDTLLFRNFINDTLTKQGKVIFHFFQNNPSVFEINSILPEIHDREFINPCFEDGPCDPDRRIHVEFFNKDSVRFYNKYCDDCYEVYYKRLNPTGIVIYNIPDLNISFYPNPANNQFTISNPSNIKITKIELIDYSGRIVQMWNANDCAGNKLNIQNISPGVYLLKAETDAGIKSEKLVVHQ